MIFEKIREKLFYAVQEAKVLQEATDSYGYMMVKKGLNHATDIVNEVETEYNNGWIYCSSGQIPKDDDYILYCGNHLANMEVDCCIGEWFLNHLEYMLAWQPLPQPPKGE